MDAVFLFAYAIGLYVSGYIGDLFDATKVLSAGLLLTAAVIAIFGSSVPYFDIHHDYYFIMIWTLNGFIQSTGWPCSVKIMGKWFGENHAGFIFGLWSANASVGNIVGAAMVALVHSHDYPIQYAFYLPAIQLCICSLCILLFVRTDPTKWNFKDDVNEDQHDLLNPKDVVPVWGNEDKDNDKDSHVKFRYSYAQQTALTTYRRTRLLWKRM